MHVAVLIRQLPGRSDPPVDLLGYICDPTNHVGDRNCSQLYSTDGFIPRQGVWRERKHQAFSYKSFTSV